MSIKNKLVELQNELNTALNDSEKADKGNKSASTRVRQSMQAIKRLAQETRELVLEIKKAK